MSEPAWIGKVDTVAIGPEGKQVAVYVEGCGVRILKAGHYLEGEDHYVGLFYTGKGIKEGYAHFLVEPKGSNPGVFKHINNLLLSVKEHKDGKGETLMYRVLVYANIKTPDGLLRIPIHEHFEPVID